MPEPVTCHPLPEEPLWQRLHYSIRLLHLWGVLNDAEFRLMVRKLEKLRAKGKV